MHQAIDATVTHAQADESAHRRAASRHREFRIGSFFRADRRFPCRLAQLGTAPRRRRANLSQQSYYPGTNDSLGHDPRGDAFNPPRLHHVLSLGKSAVANPFRFRSRTQKIAAGETLFNTRALTISNVRGLNDNAALAAALGTPYPSRRFRAPAPLAMTRPTSATTLFRSPLDIGTGHDPANETDPLIANGLSAARVPDVPVYEITGCPNPFATMPSQPAAPYVILHDGPRQRPGQRPLQRRDRIKGPILRGLAARAPYFHNGAAQNLDRAARISTTSVSR